MIPDGYTTRADAAFNIDVPVSVINEAIEEGLLTTYNIGHRVYVDKTDVDQYRKF